MSNTVISTSDYAQIVDLYNSGMSQAELESKYGVSHGVIRRILIKCGVALRDHSHKKRLYDIDESYFDSIDTPNKAYVLGLLYADGCNHVETNLIKLGLQERDAYILRDIKEDMRSTHPIKAAMLSDKNPNHQNFYELYIVNKHMSEVLSSLGVVKAKSLKLTFPEFIDEDLMWHFIRGYCDGDGSITDTNRTYISMCSTEQFCKYIKDICDAMFIRSGIRKVKSKSGESWVFYICNYDGAMKFMDCMYNNATMYLRRKHDVYLRLREKCA